MGSEPRVLLGIPARSIAGQNTLPNPPKEGKATGRSRKCLIHATHTEMTEMSLLLILRHSRAKDTDPCPKGPGCTATVVNQSCST